MEELRDERLSKIIGWLQSYIRGYISRKDFKKLQDQRLVNDEISRGNYEYIIYYVTIIDNFVVVVVLDLSNGTYCIYLLFYFGTRAVEIWRR